MSQGSTSSPTTGTVTGLNLSNNYNAAFQAQQSLNSGSASPTNDISGAAVLGQWWGDTSTAGKIRVKMFDGVSWLPFGVHDTTNHIWQPVVGGGVATLASASTTDLGSVDPAAVTISGTTTITSFGTTGVTGQIKFLKFSGILTLTYNATSLILPGAVNTVTAVGDNAIAKCLSGSSGNWEIIQYTRAAGIGVSSIAGNSGAFTLGNGLTNSTNQILVSQTAPTVQRFTSGSAQTYTPTTGMVRIRGRMCAGGGGGAAQTTNAGATGGTTSFGGWTAVGGSGGFSQSSGNAQGGVGGTGGTNGTGTLVARLNGGSGSGGSFANASGAAIPAGCGGNNPFGGGGGGGVNNSSGSAGATNTGAGGGGGAGNSGGGGGGAGEYVEFWMTAAQVGASLTYTVGTGGNGGAAGSQAGSGGAVGQIIVEEFYI